MPNTVNIQGNANVNANSVNDKQVTDIKNLFKLGEGETKLSMERLQKNIDEGGVSLKNSLAKAGVKAATEIVTGGIKLKQALEVADADIRKAEIEIEKWQNTFANRMQKIDLETGFKKQLAYMDTYMRETQNLTRASFKTLGEGITSGAWGSFDALIDYQTSKTKLNLEMQYMDTKKYIDKAKLGLENRQKMTDLENQLEQRRADKTKKGVDAVAKTSKAFGDAAMEIQHPAAMIAGGLISAGAEIGAASYELGYTREKIARELETAEVGKTVSNLQEQLDNYSIVVENEYQMRLKWLEFQKEMNKIYGQMAQTSEKQVKVFNDLATKSVNIYGYVGSQLEGMKGKDIMGGIVNWATSAYLKTEDIISAQLGYQKSTGRNVHLGERDVTAMGFLDLYAGENGITGKIASQLQAFNVSAGDTATMIAARMASLEKSGLSSKKYVQDIEKYLNLANKYNFKNGVYGLSKMVEYAQKTKFNMDSLGASLDKFSSTDISSVLESSARLNVLGGNAALFSDPLGMHYDATMDPDSFMKRMMSMTSEFGVFNKSTGMMEYDYVGTQIMKTVGELFGYPIEDMRKQINEAEKRRQIIPQMSGKGFSENEIDFLVANSYWDKLNGGWKTSVGGSEKDIKNVEVEDLKNLIPQNTEEQMMSITSNVTDMAKRVKFFLPIEEVEKRQESYNQLYTTLKDYEFFMDQFKQRIDGSYEISEKTYEMYRDKILAASEKATKDAENVRDYAEEAYNKLFVEKQPIDEIALNVKLLKNFFVGVEKGTNLDILSEVKRNEKIDEINAGLKRGETVKSLSDDENTVTIRTNNGMEYRGDVIRGANGLMKVENTTIPMYTAPSDATRVEQTPLVSNVRDAFTMGSMYSPSSLSVTSPQDVNMSWQKGGPLDTLFNGVAGKVSAIGDYVTGNNSGGGRNVNVNVTFGGKAELDCSGNRIDIGDVLMNNPFFVRKLTEEILREISKMFDGRGMVNSYVNLKNIFK